MKNTIIIGLCAILALTFLASGFMQWRYQNIIQDDVAYMSKQMIDAPEKMPWPRNQGSFPYGVHEELGLHSKVVSLFSAINQLSAFLLIVILSYGYHSHFKRRTSTQKP